MVDMNNYFAVKEKRGFYAFFYRNEECIKRFLTFPSLVYNTRDKKEKMKCTLQKIGISFIEDDYCLYIYDKNHPHYSVVSAPLLLIEDLPINYDDIEDANPDLISFKWKECRDIIIPEEEALYYAQKIFFKYEHKIKEAEILYDFNQLSMDNLCAFFERYPLDIRQYLSSGRYHIIHIPEAPKPEENDTFLEYTKTYIQGMEVYNGINTVVFDRLAIALYIKEHRTISVNLKLPKPIASVIIGTKGSNMPKLIYSLGVGRIIFNAKYEDDVKIAN